MNNITRFFQKRNVFNLTHDRKFSCDMGQLIPIMCEEVLPGDSFKVYTDMLIRLSPLVSPVMHEINAHTYYFFVPNRLLWDDWEAFITGGVDGKDAHVHPYIEMNNVVTSSLADYFNVPVNITVNNPIQVSALPFRAYNKIWNEWFRNQTLQTEIPLAKTSGVDTATLTTLQNVNWEKDYFTSALPWQQRGDPVEIPLGGTAPVVIPNDGSVGAVNQLTVGGYDSSTHAYSETQVAADTITVSLGTNETAASPVTIAGQAWNDRRLLGSADMSAVTPITVADLRLCFQIQKWLERNARAGARYIESIMAHFGVQSSDARLQRSEFLGGGKSPVIISEVLQTSKTESGAPQGNMAGHAFSAHRSHSFTKSFEEHGLIIGLMTIKPRTSYQEGLSRTLTRKTRYDYYWPLFANLAEQGILAQEIFLQNVQSVNETVWGYQGRYDEYRRRENSVHGTFKSSLNTWHMSRIFSGVGVPSLNAAFIKCEPTKRIHAVTNAETCWVYLKNNVKAIRPIPKIGEPGLIDH